MARLMIVLIIIYCTAAFGQSSPGFIQGKVLDANTNPNPSASENSIGLNQAFQGKTDYPIITGTPGHLVTIGPGTAQIQDSSITPPGILQMMTGDCTAVGVAVTCTKTSGQTFGPLATVPSVSGDCSQSGGAFTCTKTNGVSFGSLSTFAGTFGSGMVLTGTGSTTPQDSGVLLSSLMSIGGAPPNTFNNNYFYVDAAPYNAAGNGVSNDQGPLNTALTACSSAGGGTVVLGPHRYLVDTVGLTVPTRCTVYCPAPLQGVPNFANFSTSPYAIVLNSAQTITMSANSQWQGCSVIQKALSTSSVWADWPSPTTRDFLTLNATFAGTGFTWAAKDVQFRDTLVMGFAVGMSGGSPSARTRMDHVNIDSTKCLLLDNAHDISRLSHVQCFPFLENAFSSQATPAGLAISNVANNGSGAYRITLSSASSLPVTGDTVWIDSFTGPQSIQLQHWTITQIDTTHIDLQGSAGTGSVTPTGNTQSGSLVVTGLSSTANIGVGEGVSGTGIQGGTTVTWVSKNGGSIGLSLSATATNTGTTLTITDTAYSSGGNVKYDANFRNDKGFEFTNDDGVEANDLFVFDHSTSFHIGTAGNWVSCVNCWSDGSYGDISYISVLCDSSCKGASWVSGRINCSGFVVNSSTTETNILNGVIVDACANSGSNWVPSIEVDQGTVNLVGSVSRNGNPYLYFKDAATSIVMVGNDWSGGQIQFETGTGATKLSAIANRLGANTYAGTLNFGGSNVTIGGTGTPCGANNVLINCSTTIGGQYADGTFTQITMTAAGSDSPNGNQHARLYHASGTISSYTVNLPAINLGGQEFNMYFDQAVSTLTMGGTTSSGMPAAAVANTWYKCMGNPAKTTWVCSQG